MKNSSMLEHLHVENLALIDELSLDLHPGLNVFTGETGAGKTMLVGAVNILVGGGTDASLVRAGADEALVEAVFASAGGQAEGGLSASRSLFASGRSRSRLAGAVCTVSELGSSLGPLIDLHGQHEHQSLLSVDRQRALLDRFAGDAMASRLARYHELYEDVAGIRERLEAASSSADLARDKCELLAFQIDEIEKSRLRPGEDQALGQEINVLRNTEKLAEATSEASELLGRDDAGALDMLRRAVERLEFASGLDERLTGAVAALREALLESEGSYSEVGRYIDGLEFDRARLLECEERAAALALLKRKYGETVEDVLDHLDQARAELAALEGGGEDPAELERELEAKSSELREAAAELSRLRRRAAAGLEAEVARELGGLGLGGCTFEVRFLEGPGGPVLGKDGTDDLRFMIAPNAGEPALPLARSASGGELSRIMLALRIVLAAADEVPVLVFDEIDAGIGGATAAQVGERLAELSRYHQVICVTHLPQIAAYADAHFEVRKSEQDERMVTTAVVLDEAGRVAEIARMLSGAEVSEASLKHAAEMIEATRQVKQRARSDSAGSKTTEKVS